MLQTTELDAGLQVRSHQSRVQGQNHLPQTAGHNSCDATQDTAGLLHCECTLLGHIELLINRHPQGLLLGAAFNPFSTQPAFVLGIVLTHVMDLALHLVELHEVCTGPPLKPAQVPLDDIPSLECVNCTTQLGVIGKLNPTVHVVNKDVEQRQSQYQPTPEECYLSLP